MDVIDENNHHSSHYRNTSFNGLLKDKGIFDITEYLKLEDAVYKIPNLEITDKEKHKKTVRFGIISTNVLTSIVRHQAQDEGYSIKDYPANNLHLLIERMHMILDGLSSGIMPDRSNLPEIPDA